MYNSNYYELYHHGVKGQHWGERRWQNEDGSLTPAGREHYGIKAKRLEKKADEMDKSVERVKRAEDYTRGKTAYKWEMTKAVAPIHGALATVGVGSIAGIASEGESLIIPLLLGGAAGTGAVIGTLAAGAMAIKGAQAINALMINQRSKMQKQSSKVRSRAETYRSKLNENKEDNKA